MKKFIAASAVITAIAINAFSAPLQAPPVTVSESQPFTNLLCLNMSKPFTNALTATGGLLGSTNLLTGSLYSLPYGKEVNLYAVAQTVSNSTAAQSCFIDFWPMVNGKTFSNDVWTFGFVMPTTMATPQLFRTNLGSTNFQWATHMRPYRIRWMSTNYHTSFSNLTVVPWYVNN